MILELDCGNSLIKWRLLSQERGERLAGGTVSSNEELVAAVSGFSSLGLAGCRLVSVRSDDETAVLVALIKVTFSVDVCCAKPALELAGVQNGYDDYMRLGLDRWLAVVGAYSLSRRACLVLDLGTAITSDFVTVEGRHLGGYICPGVPMMRNQLRTHTRRIRYDDDQAQRALLDLVPGTSTPEAVERGCSLMLRGFVQTQIDFATSRWGEDFDIYLTGGDALLVQDVVPPSSKHFPELVFVGLAIACPGV
ncbi:pantothenate kinase [Pseudomonas sp. LRF_L74]|uniref:pantothenate kinase n=1 Tax=Pseudomonas sp. LRF_L74 TaxID=3369422 RepID=UPI003F6052F5